MSDAESQGKRRMDFHRKRGFPPGDSAVDATETTGDKGRHRGGSSGAAPPAPRRVHFNHPMDLGSHVAMSGKSMSSPSPTICTPMKGITPL